MHSSAARRAREGASSPLSPAPEDRSQESSKGVGKKNPYCYRCFTKGHVSVVCTTVLCCGICDSAEHVTKACPLMKGAKPTAILCGYAVDGLGFYFIPHTEKHVPRSDSRSALVKVIEGSLTAAQVTVELERILPGNWKWTLEEINDKTFMTTFPSNVELQRLILWGPLEAKSSKGKLEISEGKDADVWKYEIPKSWIQFCGLPKELPEFPIIWAIGSIFGVTPMVDMGFTKKCGRPRMKVAVLDPELIPECVNVVIGDYVYELQFLVEKKGDEKNPELINMDLEPKEDGDKGEENNLEKDNPSSKNIVGEGKFAGETQSNQPATDVLGSCSTPRASAHGMDCAIRPTVILKPSGKTVQGTKEWVAETFNNEQLLSTVEKAGKQSLINEVTVPVHESASTPLPMPEPAKTPTRKSNRSAATSDQDSIEKSTKLKARKNLEESSLKGSSVSSNSKLVNNLKKLERSRLQVTHLTDFPLYMGSELATENFSDGELDLLALNHFCSDLTEGFSEGEVGDLCELPAAPHRKQTRLRHFRKKGSVKH
ncbi:hypothetical protein BS78_03G065900 [Paspalum vaginatum]|nr:hypothetical protein BS78_03G065900 [Paspalum vaginatum]